MTDKYFSSWDFIEDIESLSQEEKEILNEVDPFFYRFYGIHTLEEVRKIIRRNSSQLERWKTLYPGMVLDEEEKEILDKTPTEDFFTTQELNFTEKDIREYLRKKKDELLLEKQKKESEEFLKTFPEFKQVEERANSISRTTTTGVILGIIFISIGMTALSEQPSVYFIVAGILAITGTLCWSNTGERAENYKKNTEIQTRRNKSIQRKPTDSSDVLGLVFVLSGIISVGLLVGYVIGAFIFKDLRNPLPAYFGFAFMALSIFSFIVISKKSDKEK